MPKFSMKSQGNLANCDQRLKDIFNEAIKVYDFSIIYGHRGQKEQDESFAKGHSKLKWPQSKHNKLPATAVDAAPYPIDWNNKKRFCVLAGIVKAIAFQKGIKIRWGADWDGDGDPDDWDFPHFELVD